MLCLRIRWKRALSPCDLDIWVFGLSLAGLGEVDLLGLQTLRAALYDKGHFGAFIERTVAGRLNSRKMDENILAG